MLQAVITTFLRPLRACVKGSKNFRRIYKLPQNFRRQNGDKKRVPHRWRRNIRRHLTKFSCPGDLRPPDVYIPGLVWWRTRYFVAACHGDRNIGNPIFEILFFERGQKPSKCRIGISINRTISPESAWGFLFFFPNLYNHKHVLRDNIVMTLLITKSCGQRNSHQHCSSRDILPTPTKVLSQKKRE
jgi:hypothetical protein